MSDATGERSDDATDDVPSKVPAERTDDAIDDAPSKVPAERTDDAIDDAPSKVPAEAPSVRLPGTRADLFGALAIIAGTAGLVLGPGLIARLSAHPSAVECDALLARYVEMKERAVTEKLDPKGHAAALDDARRLAGPSFAACTTEITLEEAECARKAGNADELERCLR